MQDLNAKFVAAVASPFGGWVSYPWRTDASAPVVTKVAYVVPVTDASGASYYAGVGYDQVAAPTTTPCNAAYDAPCSNGNALSLTGHAASMANSAATAAALSDVWSAITTSATYKVDTGFYVFAYNYNGTNVAHGSNSDFVGQTLQQILDGAGIVTITGAQLNAKFIAAAEAGGGLVSYLWGTGAAAGATWKTSYVTKVVLDNDVEYYVGSGFGLSALPAAAGACDANAVLADSSCQVTNSLSVFGNAQARLQACGSDWGCFSGVLWDITYTTKYVVWMLCVSCGVSD